MSENVKAYRLSKFAKEYNIGHTTIIEFLAKKGHQIPDNPNAKLDPEMVSLLDKEFRSHKTIKKESETRAINYSDRQSISIEDRPKRLEDQEIEVDELVIRDSTISAETQTAVDEEREITEKPAPSVPQERIKEPEEPLAAEQEALKAGALEEEAEPVRKEEKAVKKAKEPVGPKVVGKIELKETKPKSRKKTKAAEEQSEAETAKPETPGEVQAEEKIAEEARVAEAKTDLPDKETPAIGEPPVEKSMPDQPEEIKKEQPEDHIIRARAPQLRGPVILDKIEITDKPRKPEKKPVASSKDEVLGGRKKRKRIKKKTDRVAPPPKEEKGRDKFKDRKLHKDKARPEVSAEDVQKQIKETLAKLTGSHKSKGSKYRREKRQIVSQQKQAEKLKQEEESKVIKVTEFVTANELANMMHVPVTDIISTFMDLRMFVSINQRLDAETLALVAEEFGYKVEFVSVEVQEAIMDSDVEEDVGQLTARSPIVTVMGHVDHGKTKLLDHIRKTNVIAGEAGGITQHIGAYEVSLDSGKRITFLDTPGHEAFTAMRARGAKVTDVAIIVIAADDSVMPQTVEAINHAQAASVPIVFAINKIDKPGANPEKIREQLANMNILVEDWGGKYQCQEISAKAGINIDLLLDKVLLEAELLDLKADSFRRASGTVLESSLDKGRGYVTKVLVQSGTLKIGDIVIAGTCFGKVKAMYNERNIQVREAGPSSPILLLGMNGAPQAGDIFNVMRDEREAKNIASKRYQLQREQGLRSQKHITLDEIGRRIAIGDFKELNVIVKGDVAGSVEALGDSLLKLSNEQVQVNVIHRSVGQVTETDVMLASASDAIIVCFQVRPSLNARKLAEQEQIDIRTYSVIYQAIEEIKAAIEGMLAPEIQEKITCNVEVRDVFRISKAGTVAGCMVLDGVITRNTKVRVIRDGIVVYSGDLSSLKRFKDDVKEVKTGYECGVSIENYNDIKVGDIIEGYEEVEVKRKL
ncbi:MAG: translation initiation factor IF-2 [Bacteroidales bacterium]|nr:translation initiation factor IF-2 [Bacteroidales bacterium]